MSAFSIETISMYTHNPCITKYLLGMKPLVDNSFSSFSIDKGIYL